LEAKSAKDLLRFLAKKIAKFLTAAITWLGYQGIEKTHGKSLTPIKRPGGGTFTADAKRYNRAVAKLRIFVENVFAQFKTFKILSARYRNRQKQYNMRFRIIAGIVNLESRRPENQERWEQCLKRQKSSGAELLKNVLKTDGDSFVHAS
jgi:hypothetical protein